MLNVGELGLWQQEVSKGSYAVVLDLMNFGVGEILHTHSVTMRGISDELVPLHGYIIPKEFNMANKAEKSQEQVQEQKVVQWVKGQNDADFRNSVGFFKDPFTGVEFGDEQIKAERIPGHKYAHIYASDGKTVIPLSSKFWTRQEKDDYNNSRKNPGSGTGSTTRCSSSAKNEELRKGLTALKNYLAEKLPGDEQVEKYISALMPADPSVEKMQKQIANMTDEQKALLKSLLG